MWLTLIMACVEGPADSRPTEAWQAAIGPDGGVLTSDDGLLTLDVPPDALSETVQIRITAVEAEDFVGGIAYDLQPDELVFDIPAQLTLELPSGVPSEEGARPVLAARMDPGGEDPLYQVWPTIEADGQIVSQIDHFSIHGLVECRAPSTVDSRGARYLCLDVEMGSDGRTIEIDRTPLLVGVERARVELPLTEQEAKQLPFPFAIPPRASFVRRSGPNQRYWTDPQYGRATVLWYKAVGSVFTHSVVYFPPEEGTTTPPPCDIRVAAWRESADHGLRTGDIEWPRNTTVRLSPSETCFLGVSMPEVRWEFQSLAGEGGPGAPVSLGSGQSLDWSVERGILTMVVSSRVDASGGAEEVRRVSAGVTAAAAPYVTYISPIEAQPVDVPITFELFDAVSGGPVLDGPFAEDMGEVQWELWEVFPKTGVLVALDEERGPDDHWTLDPQSGAGLGVGTYEVRSRVLSPDGTTIMGMAPPRRFDIFEPAP